MDSRSSGSSDTDGFSFSFIAVITPLLASRLVFVITVVPQERIEPILAGLGSLINKHACTAFVTDVTVSRLEHCVVK